MSMRTKRLLELALTVLFLLLASAALWLTDADRLIASLVPRDLAIAAMQSDCSRAWPAGNLLPWQLLYTWAPYPALLLAAAASVVLLASLFRESLAPWRRKAAFIILCIALGPGLIINIVLKEQMGRARPREIVEFGGSHQFTQFWQPGKAGANSSFPSGHAAIAFAVLAPWFALRDEETRTAAGFLAAGLIFGVLVGIARILQGGHFASDILWAGGLVYLIGGLLALLMGLSKESGARQCRLTHDPFGHEH